MATLFGKSWKRQELLDRVGDIRQIADVRLSELSDGAGRGVRMAEFQTGSGFSFTVLIDRGLDIHDASYNGLPVAFQSPAGISHPAYFEPESRGWLRNFHGGWLNTCGLTNVGVPGRDELGEYGMHGRASNLPAKLSGYGGKWLGDDYEM
ncbi:aldose 1-epimerase family protein, partial [bacterium]|nr:aldose 1-epimerase family protein [bacterium]